MGLRDDFQSWAAISAKLFRRPAAARALIMRDAGVGEEWVEADQHWFEVLCNDAEAGGSDRLEQYLAMCQAEVERVRHTGGSLVSPMAALPPHARLPWPMGTPAATRPGETPAFASGLSAPQAAPALPAAITQQNPSED